MPIGKTVVTSHKQKQKWTAKELIHLVTQLPRLDFGASSLIRYWLLQKKHIHRKTFRASSLDFCTHRSMALTTSFKEYAQHHETKCVTFPQTLQKMITLFAKCSRSHWNPQLISADVCCSYLILYTWCHLAIPHHPWSGGNRGKPWKPSGHCMHLPTRPQCCSGAFHLWDMSCCNPYLAKCQAKNTRDTALKMLQIWCFNYGASMSNRVKRHALCWDYSRQGKGPADPCAKFGQIS